MVSGMQVDQRQGHWGEGLLLGIELLAYCVLQLQARMVVQVEDVCEVVVLKRVGGKMGETLKSREQKL
jgi:hypothetical protein